MIAVYYDCGESAAGQSILGSLAYPEESWGKASQLHHQTQQRSDNFIARENQHIAQRHPARLLWTLAVGNLWTSGLA